MTTRSPFTSLLLLFALAAGGCRSYAATRYVDADAGDAGDAASAIAVEAGGDGGADIVTSGALCGANGRDDCGPFAICEATLGCVECATSADCPAAAPQCLHGTCVGCRPSSALALLGDAGSSDCPSPNSACWTADYECNARCTNNSECPDETICDELSGGCVGCASDAECSSGVCSKVLGRCVECESDATCPGQRPRCRRLTGACVSCISNDDCGVAAPICDPITFACRVGCSSDAACPGQRCDVVTARCVDVPMSSADAGADGE